jgi:heat shock protein HslJ
MKKRLVLPVFFLSSYKCLQASHDLTGNFRTTKAMYIKQTINSSIFRLRFVILCSVLFSLAAVAAENKVSTAELGNTYWKLTELVGEVVITAENQREMKITLRGENKVTGFAGCNSFFGSYQHDETTLTFGQLAAGRMFCADSMDKESKFMQSLGKVKTYKITGQTLHLLDAEEKLLATFEAVYLK